MANKNVKLKNKNGDYLYPYTDNIPTASTSTAGKVRLDSSPTSGSNNAITSGAVHTALSSKADDSAVAHKTGAETFTGNKTLQASNDDAWQMATTQMWLQPFRLQEPFVSRIKMEKLWVMCDLSELLLDYKQLL